ncbi:hypothetical protein HYR54_16755 [Candidatus Acetothermia bacterium]|nr:hypothetical protein [Candidatus Acetothermia bacterium]
MKEHLHFQINVKDDQGHWKGHIPAEPFVILNSAGVGVQTAVQSAPDNFSNLDGTTVFIAPPDPSQNDPGIIMSVDPLALQSFPDNYTADDGTTIYVDHPVPADSGIHMGDHTIEDVANPDPDGGNNADAQTGDDANVDSSSIAPPDPSHAHDVSPDDQPGHDVADPDPAHDAGVNDFDGHSLDDGGDTSNGDGVDSVDDGYPVDDGSNDGPYGVTL